MPSIASSLLLLLPLVAAHDVIPRNLHQLHHARQAPNAAAASSPVASATGSSSSSAAAAPPPVAATGSAVSSSVLPDSTLTATDPAIPPLSQITSGMPPGPTETLPTSVTLGQAGPFPGFPPLPSTTLNLALYPTPTGTIVPFDPTVVAGWLKELEGHQIPDIPPTNEGGCSNNTAAANDPTRCWWTCGGCTRSSDVFTCPDKQTWGLTFDDGPSPNTPKLLNYLKANNLRTTFAVVGGSNYFFPDVLRDEYALGNHIIVHTYRHPYMTTLTTPEIVAELGYTRQIIKDTIGVTPAYWRPPYGDVDDRVRAIAYAMGLETIIWTRNPSTLDQFDTNDWRIPAGQVTGPQAFQQFENILANASMLNTGFIVLEHDLYEQTVDLAVGYTLPTALAHNPKFNIMPVIDCLHLQPSEAYIETMTGTNRTAPVTTWTGGFIADPASLLNTTTSVVTTTNAGGQVVTSTIVSQASGSVTQSGGKSSAMSMSVSLGALVMAASVVLGAVAL